MNIHIGAVAAIVALILGTAACGGGEGAASGPTATESPRTGPQACEAFLALEGSHRSPTKGVSAAWFNDYADAVDGALPQLRSILESVKAAPSTVYLRMSVLERALAPMPEISRQAAGVMATNVNAPEVNTAMAQVMAASDAYAQLSSACGGPGVGMVPFSSG